MKTLDEILRNPPKKEITTSAITQNCCENRFEVIDHEKWKQEIVEVIKGLMPTRKMIVVLGEVFAETIYEKVILESIKRIEELKK